VVKAITEQAGKLIHYSWSDFYYKPLVELGEELNSITPGSYPKAVYFSSSGSEANEAAMKVSRWHTRRSLFLAYTGAYHGTSFGALSLTASKPITRRHFFPLTPEVTHVPFPYCYRCPLGLDYPKCNMRCVDYIEEEVLTKFHPPEDTAAMFVEPIQGESGYVVPPDGYYQRLKKLLDKYSIMMVSDEVQSGIGRTGKWFAIEHWDVIPEIITSAKPLASGLPIGATIAKEEIMDWERGTHTNTTGANPVSCAAALQVIDIIREEKLLENATRQGTYILKRLNELQQEYPINGDVRGKGLMMGAEFVKDKETKEPAVDEAHQIVTKCFKRGLTLMITGNSTVAFSPPLIITRDLIDAALDVFEGAVKEVASQMT
jgi:4-aminobutyrate aminotransferase